MTGVIEQPDAHTPSTLRTSPPSGGEESEIRGEFRARFSAGQFGPAIRPRRGAPGLCRPQSQEPHAPPGGLRGDAGRQHPHHAAQFAVPAHRGARRRLPAVGRRRPRIHRRAGRIHRRHLRPLPSGDPRRHRPRAEPRLELRRPQRQRGQARQAGGRPHALDRPGALHQLGHRGQRHGAGRRARLSPSARAAPRPPRSWCSTAATTAACSIS